MEVINVSNIPALVLNRPIIGYGSSAICFLLPDMDVLKLYLPTPHTYNLFEYFDMQEHLEYLRTLENESYIGPNKIYMYKGRIIGYSMRYVMNPTLKRVSQDTLVSNLLIFTDVLFEDTMKISEHRYRIGDMHYKNILYDDIYHVIDLDNGEKDDVHSVSSIAARNCQDIAGTIIKGIFNVDVCHNMIFKNSRLMEQYENLLYRDYQLLNDFINELKEEIKNDDATIRDMRKVRSKLLYLEGRE